MRHLRWILLAASVLLIAGCRQQTQNAAAGFTIHLRTEPENPAVGESTLRIAVRGADGTPITHAKVSVRGDMNHAGMMPVLAAAERVENGEYVVPFEWSMAGDWMVEVTVELPDGIKESETFQQFVAVSEATETMDMGEG
jgi:hypothetical protein